MHAEHLRAAIMAAPKDRLPGMAQEMWQAFSAGRLTEAEAEDLGGLIATRQSKQTTTPTPRVHVGSRPRSDASMERRRRWAASGRMPPGVACRFTLAEQAVLAVVSAETAKRGDCRLFHGAIAALAGVAVSTVRATLRRARDLDFITSEERRSSAWRNLSSVVRIVSREWQAWNRLARDAGGQGGADISAERTSTQVSNRRPERAFRTSEGAFEKRRRRLTGRPYQQPGAGPIREAK